MILTVLVLMRVLKFVALASIHATANLVMLEMRTVLVYSKQIVHNNLKIKIFELLLCFFFGYVLESCTYGTLLVACSEAMCLTGLK